MKTFPTDKPERPLSVQPADLLGSEQQRVGCADTGQSGGSEPNAPSLGEHVLALATGKTRQELYVVCHNDRPNHIGIAVQRHIRAGRIQERDGKLYAPSPAAHSIA